MNCMDITITEKRDKYTFKLKGNINSNYPDVDIIRGGVSALCGALINELDILKEENEIEFINRKIIPGDIDIEIEFFESEWGQVRTEEAFAVIGQGFENIERLYPECINISVVYE